jgi:hypothetical protein
MIIPKDALIPETKIRDYLFRPQLKDDKSKFLGLAGYSVADFQRLIKDIRDQLLPGEAVFQERTIGGEIYRLRGILTGPNGYELHVRTIWAVEVGHPPRFVTLVPDRKPK